MHSNKQVEARLQIHLILPPPTPTLHPTISTTLILMARGQVPPMKDVPWMRGMALALLGKSPHLMVR